MSAVKSSATPEIVGNSSPIRYPFSAAPSIPVAPTRTGWMWHRLTDIARLATGHTPSRRHPEYWEGDIPWLQLPDIRALDGRVASDTSEHINTLGIENSAAVLLPARTVCMSRTASVGFVTVMGRPMATSQDFVNWVCGPQLHPEFLMHLLIACRDPIRELGSGAVHHTIYFPTVEDFGVCIPPLVEQRRIAGELTAAMEAVDRARRAAQARLAAAGALAAAYLREVFEGPEGQKWEVCDLGDSLIRIEAGTSVVAHERPANVGEWGVLKVSALSWGSFRPNENKAVLPDYVPAAHEHVCDGDLLISRCNTAELTGAVVVVHSPPPNLMLSDKTLRLVVRPECFEKSFLEVALRTRAARKFIESRATGSSHSMRNISQEAIRMIPVQRPPVKVQREVMSSLRKQLSQVPQLIECCREELTAIEALPAAYLRRAFEGLN